MKGHIWLSVQREGQEAVIRVRDSGIGISPELLPRIFRSVYPGISTLDRSQGGLGIGLALVERLVAMHGGRVEATSTPGQGSEFVVRLPVVSAPTSTSPESPTHPEEAHGQSLRVLVVDDNIDVAQTLAVLLKSCGHKVEVAHDGPTALEAARTYRPNLILLDIGLPGMDGFEVAKKVRQEMDLGNVVLVAMTGYGQDSDKKRTQEIGFDHHLVKPADFREIKQILPTVARSEA